MGAPHPEPRAWRARRRRDAGGASLPPRHGNGEEPRRRPGRPRGAPAGAPAAGRDDPHPGGGAGRTRRPAVVRPAARYRTDGALAAPQPPVHGGDGGDAEPRHRRHGGNLFVRRRHPPVAARLPGARPVDDGADRDSRAGGPVSGAVRQRTIDGRLAAHVRGDLPRDGSASTRQRGRYWERLPGTASRRARLARLLRAAGSRAAARPAVSVRRERRRRRCARGGTHTRAVAAPLRRRSGRARAHRRARRSAGPGRRRPAGLVPVSAVRRPDARRERQVGPAGVVRTARLDRVAASLARGRSTTRRSCDCRRM